MSSMAVRTKRCQMMLFTTAVFCGMFCMAEPAAGQSMNYSVYNDLWSAEGNVTMFGYTELDDVSGCGSGAGSPQTWLYSPSRVQHAYASTASMAFADEEGEWRVSGTHQIQCNCAPQGGGHTFTAGFTSPFLLSIVQTYYSGCAQAGDKSCNCTYITCIPPSAPSCGYALFMFYSGGACTFYMGASYLKSAAAPNYNYTCVFGYAWSTTGPGWCW